MSCSCANTAEDLFYAFLITLGIDEIKTLYTGYDAENRLDEESEEELRSAVWNVVRNRIRWGYVLQKVKDELELDEDEDEVEDEEEDSD